MDAEPPENTVGPGSGELLLELRTGDRRGGPIYLAGNFNGWKVADPAYRLERLAPGKFCYRFPDRGKLPPVLEYKYVRKNWDGEELDLHGNTVSNRCVDRDVVQINDFVPRWKRQGLTYKPELLPDIRVMKADLPMPKAIKTRRVAALLPHDYELSDRRYPVLYLQDGQNLYDEHAPFGNWGLDKKLAVMAERGFGDLIIVAIDHAENDRIREFTPSAKTRLGRGDGKRYVRFLAEHLKPHVDKHFRTLPDRDYTGIGGSSMGGLISIYAGLMYPELFSKLMIFSPSLWVAPDIHAGAKPTDVPMDTRIYIYGGGAESATMIPNIQRFMTALEQHIDSENLHFNLSIDPHGHHNEHRWGEEFPQAAEWLFFHNLQ